MTKSDHQTKPIYQQIYTVVKEIPAGRVATYGQIGHVAGCSTPRMVGYAMAGLPKGTDVPWHRVINAAGKISPRGNPISSEIQRQLLQEEGITFTKSGNVNLNTYRWSGPTWEWLVEHGLDTEGLIDR